ncbi:hypothetical protein LL06_15430 [Hoeflea sp. BAL378]|nr:hypothetical protein LL06_15430 [Hoeflea sp. BAL378]
MVQDQDARWIAPGGGYRRRSVRHDETYQAVRLKAAGVDPSLYGDAAETGLFGLDCFDSMVDAGCNIDGYVFLSQTYRLIRAPALDEKLEIDGYVRDLAETSRGPVASEIYRFSDSQGRVCLESELTGLLALPHGVVAEGAPALPRRDAQPADGWEMVQEKRVTPDDVRLFSQDVGNEVHFDVEFARQHGFRAPIAQGIMSAVWLLSAIYGLGVDPVRFNVDIRYLRPVFWDDYASLWVRRRPDGSIAMVQCRNQDGKVTADLTVLSMTTQAGNRGA